MRETIQYLVLPYDLTERQSLIYMNLYKRCNFSNMTVETTVDQVRNSIKIIELTNRMITADLKKMCEAGYLQLVERGVKGKPSKYKIIKIKDMKINDEVSYREVIGNLSVSNREVIGNLSVNNNLAIPMDREGSREVIGNLSVSNREVIGNLSGSYKSTLSKDKDKDNDNDKDIKDTQNENSLLDEKPEPKPLLKEEDKLSLKDVTLPYYMKTEAEKIIFLLNKAAGKNFKVRTANIEQLINKLLDQGYALEDFILVIEHKTSQWKGTQELNLRPAVLFGNNFSSYLKEAKAARETAMPQVTAQVAPKYIDKVRALATFVPQTKPMRMAARVGAGAYRNDVTRDFESKEALERHLLEFQKNKGM